ncbi:MAG: BolA family transcriptional regulator [Paracoccaceae bacterium]|jgi:BolA family transcriptional regulator, general stress-responsive regulator|nr:BolA family transcriptional regulator [Paracoccaceae bacterium]
MSRMNEIKLKLEQNFVVQNLEVLDESEQHRGHSGFQEGGESHFRIRLTTASFKGQSRISCHRAVHAALGQELLGAIHALALELDIPAS